MEEWSSYAIANFIPFTADVYLRLVERVNAAWWPLHLATTVIGIGALAMALTGRRRFAGPLLALLWGLTAYGFLQQFYTNLNWAGAWFACGFYLQAVLLALLMFAAHRHSTVSSAPVRSGLLLAGIALFWPVISMIGRDTVWQTEVVGIHPDPTAIFSLGAILLIRRGRWLLALLPIPLLWCVISGLSLWALALPQAGFLFATPGIAILVLCWRAAKK